MGVRISGTVGNKDVDEQGARRLQLLPCLSGATVVYSDLSRSASAKRSERRPDHEAHADRGRIDGQRYKQEPIADGGEGYEPCAVAEGVSKAVTHRPAPIESCRAPPGPVASPGPARLRSTGRAVSRCHHRDGWWLNGARGSSELRACSGSSCHHPWVRYFHRGAPHAIEFLRRDAVHTMTLDRVFRVPDAMARRTVHSFTPSSEAASMAVSGAGPSARLRCPMSGPVSGRSSQHRMAPVQPRIVERVAPAPVRQRQFGGHPDVLFLDGVRPRQAACATAVRATTRSARIPSTSNAAHNAAMRRNSLSGNTTSPTDLRAERCAGQFGVLFGV